MRGWRWWILGFVFLVVFALGIIRLAFDQRPSQAVDIKMANELASCLGASKDVAANAAVAVLPLPADIDKPAKPPKGAAAVERDSLKPLDPAVLRFATTKPVQVELQDPTVRKDFHEKRQYETTSPLNVTVSGARGDFEFELQKGPVVLHTAEGQFLAKPGKPLRFGPAERTPYAVTLDPRQKIESKTETGQPVVAILPAGTTGSLEIGAGQPLVSLQPVTALPWLFRTLPTLVPVRALGQQGLSDLTIEARQPGIPFNSQGFLLAACAWSPAIGTWRPVGIAEARAQGTGAATLRLAIPPDVLPWDIFWVPIEVAIASLDGQYRGYGGFSAIGKIWAAGIALAVAILLFAWLSTLRGHQLQAERKQDAKSLKDIGRMDDAAEMEKPLGWAPWFSGLFIGPDKDPSLSLLQIFIWTVITVWGILYVYIVAGNLLTMTASMMALLGIAGAGSVAARWVAASTTPAGASLPAPDSRPARAKTFEFWQVLSTDGKFDLLKLQLFVFTLTIGVYVVWRIAETAAFPELDANTVLLLGVSQGIYVGSKVAGSTALSRAQALKVELDARKEARKNIGSIDELKAKKKVLDDKKTAADGKLDQVDQAELNRLNDQIKTAEDLDKVIPDLETKLKAAAKELGLTA